MSETFDYLIVGGGIVGVTTALELKKRNKAYNIALLEKESVLGMHGSTHNSGVLHAGIYYGSDSLKARVCSKGSKALIEYGQERGIKVVKTGKVIVATTEDTVDQIEVLEKRALSNGINVKRINEKELKEIEPYAVSCGDALYSPDTAVIDSKAVMEELAKDLESNDIKVFCDEKVLDINTLRKVVKTKKNSYGFGHLINTAGAFADTIAHYFNVGRQYSVVPFKGVYFKLKKEKDYLVNGSIYPAPDLNFPFLGVHLTRGFDGTVYAGPGAVPAFGRENYFGLKGFDPAEAPFIAGRLAAMFIKNEDNFRGLVKSEIEKYKKIKFVEAIRKLVPDIEEDDLEFSTKRGIRPQIVNTDKWKLEMDFILESGKDSTHVLNAISPAFTGSMEFAKLVSDKAEANK